MNFHPKKDQPNHLWFLGVHCFTDIFENRWVCVRVSVNMSKRKGRERAVRWVSVAGWQTDHNYTNYTPINTKRARHGWINLNLWWYLRLVTVVVINNVSFEWMCSFFRFFFCCAFKIKANKNRLNAFLMVQLFFSIDVIILFGGDKKENWSVKA